MKGKKTSLKKIRPAYLSPLNLSGENTEAFEATHFANASTEKYSHRIKIYKDRHSDGDDVNHPILWIAERLARQRNKRRNHGMGEEQKKKEDKKHSSSSSSSKDKRSKLNRKPHKQDLKNSRINLVPKITLIKGFELGEKKKSNIQPKKSPYHLTQSHIRYSKQEEPKKEEPKQSSPKVEEKQRSKAGTLSSKVERPILNYHIDRDALMDKAKLEPLSISGLHHLGNEAEKRENLRVGALEQLSKIELSSKQKRNNASGNDKAKPAKAEKEDAKADPKEHSKPKQTPFDSSSGSDSEDSETPKGNAKEAKTYINAPKETQKGFEKTYKEDEGNETPSDSKSSLDFYLLTESLKNKKPAPNASNVKTKLPPPSDESQHIDLKTTEGQKKPSNINEVTPKSNDKTPTPNDKTPKSDTPKSSKKNKKSDGSSSSDSDKQSKRSESSSSHKSKTSKSGNSSSSDENKQSSHSKSSKKSSKKFVKSSSEDNDSEKHSDNEDSKSDEKSNKEQSSSNNGGLSGSEHSSKKFVQSKNIFGKSLAESIVNEKASNKEDKKSSDEENENGSEEASEEEDDEASEKSEK